MLNRFFIRAGVLMAMALSATACSSTGEVNFLGSNSSFPAAANMQGDSALSRAKAHFRNGDYGLSERYYREAAEQTPEQLEAWVGLAASYDQLKRFDLADRAYEQALKLSNDSPVVLNNIGYSHLLRGEAGKAGGYFKKALVKDPENARIKGNIVLAEELAAQGTAQRARPEKI